MTRIRFGVLGCSSVAERRVLPALAGASNAALTHVGSRDLEKARTFARKFGAAKSGAYEDVLRDPNVDAVYLSLPAALHETWIRAALESGKHVYCEKPAFASEESAAALIRLARAKGRRVMEGFMFRHHPQHARVRELIAQGRLGRPRLFRAEYFYPRPADGDIRLDSALGGGALMDAGGYTIAAALELLGAPSSVSGTWTRDVSGVDGMAALTLGFPGDRFALCAAGFGLQYRARYSIAGEMGSAELSRAFAVAPDQPTTIELETGMKKETISVPAADQFRLMIERFAGALLDPTAISDDFEGWSLRLHRVLSAARRACAEQRVVELSEAAA